MPLVDRKTFCRAGPLGLEAERGGAGRGRGQWVGRGGSGRALVGGLGRAGQGLAGLSWAGRGGDCLGWARQGSGAGLDRLDR